MSFELLRLEGRGCSALIEFTIGQAPVWRHFGLLVGQTLLHQKWSATDVRRLPVGGMDRLSGLPVLPCFGNGLPGAAALRAHRSGFGAVHELVAERYELSAGKEVQALVLHLVDDVRDEQMSLRATVNLSLDVASDVLTLSCSLHNTGKSPLIVDALASGSLPVPSQLQTLGSFTGKWAHEFQWKREAVPAAGWVRESRHGRTSHEAPPACFLLGAQADEHSGQVLGAQLAWSGNHRFALDRHDDGSLVLQAGEWLAAGEVILAPGESHETPSLHLTWSNGGLNGASQNFHQFTRQRVLEWHGKAMTPRPVHLNTWEAVYFDHDQSVLRDLATNAAKLGVERFVLDDGWFPGRPNDRSGLGDWWPDPVKYPQGLGPLISYVKGLGMAFGLWVEPEMVNPDSDLYRAHPDWALQVAGRPLQFGRHQLVLDVARPEVSEYLFEKLNALLVQYPISYLKWDMNRDLAQAGDAHGRMAYRVQVLALYALLARLRSAHPSVEIESCASGGARADLGVLRHTNRLWTSDNNDAVSRVAIQSGATRMFPLELLGAHVGPAPAHSTGRAQSMGFRCAVACFGHMGVEADVRKLSEEDSTTLARWIGFHKAWRSVLHGGVFHQGRTGNGSVWWLAQTAQKCLLGIFTVTPPDFQHQPLLVLPSFKGTGAWKVKLGGEAGLEAARAESPALWREALCGQGVSCQGDELASMGLPLLVMNPESALVFSFEKIAP